MSTILLAGGAGYIGSHTAVELLNEGYEVIVADNYSNCSPEAIRRVEKITNKTVKLYQVDVRDNNKVPAKEKLDKMNLSQLYEVANDHFLTAITAYAPEQQKLLTIIHQN